MRCPFCQCADTKVTDSRATDDGKAIRRRRECQQCGRRFTTYEMVEEVPLVVVKKDGRHELFDRNKLLNGLLRACNKREVKTAAAGGYRHQGRAQHPQYPGPGSVQ